MRKKVSLMVTRIPSWVRSPVTVVILYVNIELAPYIQGEDKTKDYKRRIEHFFISPNTVQRKCSWTSRISPRHRNFNCESYWC